MLSDMLVCCCEGTILSLSSTTRLRHARRPDLLCLSTPHHVYVLLLVYPLGFNHHYHPPPCTVLYRYGDTAALTRLLDRGCPVDAADYDGRSLLHVAVHNKREV